MSFGYLHALFEMFANLICYVKTIHINPIALKKAKIVYNFGLSECNRVK